MEHETYSISAAEPALAELRQRGIVLVMNSSKTAAEMRAIQARLSLPAPFVCENGAALYYPTQGKEPPRQVFGRLRSEWLPAVHALRDKHRFQFKGFADWSPEKIAELTGLDRATAALAKDREFSEPILWRSAESSKAQFSEYLHELGLSLLEGGRFLSIQGQHDKSLAMDWLVRQQDQKTITVALGDSPNDSAMLEAADIAVIIKSAKSDRITLQKPHKIIRSKRPGPAGWQDAMTEILSWLDSGKLSTIGR